MTSSKIYIAGHNGMVGRALKKQLKKYTSKPMIFASREELDLKNQKLVRQFFSDNKIDEVYLAAAKVGGIQANNNYPAEFIYENLQIELNIIQAAHEANVQKLLFLGSSCIYPKNAQQPIEEHCLLSGILEPTNEPYAIAKIAGIKMCESYNRQYNLDYRSVMPTNLYGPWDNFHPENSHVVPGLIRRFHEAKIENKKEVIIWGTGKPFREFLHVDDMAKASIFVLGLDKSIYESNTELMTSHINVGSENEITISGLSKLISSVVGFDGNIIFDTSKKDGPPRKLMNSSRLKKMGWTASIDLEEGIKNTYQWYKNNYSLFNQ
jgi:GDP-L-fucose synthase